MKLAIEESVLRQALDTLMTPTQPDKMKVITNLRAAIEQMEKAEPVATVDNGVLNWVADRQIDNGDLYPAPAVPDFTCPYCKHEQPYAEIHCHNCNARYTIDAAPTPGEGE